MGKEEDGDEREGDFCEAADEGDLNAVPIVCRGSVPDAAEEQVRKNGDAYGLPDPLCGANRTAGSTGRGRWNVDEAKSMLGAMIRPEPTPVMSRPGASSQIDRPTPEWWSATMVPARPTSARMAPVTRIPTPSR